MLDLILRTTGGQTCSLLILRPATATGTHGIAALQVNMDPNYGLPTVAQVDLCASKRFALDPNTSTQVAPEEKFFMMTFASRRVADDAKAALPAMLRAFLQMPGTYSVRIQSLSPRQGQDAIRAAALRRKHKAPQLAHQAPPGAPHVGAATVAQPGVVYPQQQEQQQPWQATQAQLHSRPRGATPPRPPVVVMQQAPAPGVGMQHAPIMGGGYHHMARPEAAPAGFLHPVGLPRAPPPPQPQPRPPTAPPGPPPGQPLQRWTQQNQQEAPPQWQAPPAVSSPARSTPAAPANNTAAKPDASAGMRAGDDIGDRAPPAGASAAAGSGAAASGLVGVDLAAILSSAHASAPAKTESATQPAGQDADASNMLSLLQQLGSSR